MDGCTGRTAAWTRTPTEKGVYSVMDLEIISSLEKKIDSLIEYCTNLREEKKSLEETLAGVQSENSRLATELSMLEEERKGIGERVERMLQRIDGMESAYGQGDHPVEQQKFQEENG